MVFPVGCNFSGRSISFGCWDGPEIANVRGKPFWEELEGVD